MGRQWLLAGVALALAAASPVYADMYTWVDKNGVTNISNEQPPEGVRVTKVVRTAPKDPAREAATRQAEMRALRDRVDELSKEVELSRNDGIPPPYAPAPVMAFSPPAAPPAPTVVVTVINQPAQTAQPEMVPSGCDYTFGGCGSYFPGYTYYAPPYQRGYHKPSRKSGAMPTRQTFGIPPPLIPYPMTPARSVSGRRLG